jgi:PAS domain S-box-containing protein
MLRNVALADPAMVDITEHRRAVEAVRLSQQAIASITQGVLISGPDRLTLSVNRAFETITGYSQSELVGQPCSVLQGPNTSAETLRQLRDALAAEKPFTGEDQLAVAL